MSNLTVPALVIIAAFGFGFGIDCIRGKDMWERLLSGGLMATCAVVGMFLR